MQGRGSRRQAFAEQRRLGVGTVEERFGADEDRITLDMLHVNVSLPQLQNCVGDGHVENPCEVGNVYQIDLTAATRAVATERRHASPDRLHSFDFKD